MQSSIKHSNSNMFDNSESLLGNSVYDGSNTAVLSAGTTTTTAATAPTTLAASTTTYSFAVGVSAVWTSPLKTIVTSSGLAAGKNIATLGPIGGSINDTYTYTLSGSGSFAISSNGILSTGSSGVAGSTTGKLYALTANANDLTTGTTGGGQIDVVVGSGSADTINVAQIGGIATSVPTFIYGTGGGDKISGAGMTGKLYFFASGKGDTMTGGSGGNMYEYGATTDSTSSAMDIITNFNAATDVLDFSGTGLLLNATTTLASNATTIAANTVGWQTSGGNTFVYVNGTSKSVSLGAASMKIELLGNVALTAADIARA